jgi:hypothetical protein
MHQGATQPIRYCVVVRGRLGRNLADAFGYFELDSSGGESSLTGTFADQASCTASSTGCVTSASPSSASTQ